MRFWTAACDAQAAASCGWQTTPNVAEAETDRCLVEAAQRVVVVADHSKLSVVVLAKIASLSRVDVLVTHEGPMLRPSSTPQLKSTYTRFLKQQSRYATSEPG